MITAVDTNILVDQRNENSAFRKTHFDGLTIVEP